MILTNLNITLLVILASVLLFVTILLLLKKRPTIESKWYDSYVMFTMPIRLVLWVKPSFEGNDGRASYRRLSAFAVICVYVYSRYYFLKTVTDPYWLTMGTILDIVFYLLIIGIIVIQDLVILIQQIKGSQLDKTIEKVDNAADKVSNAVDKVEDKL